MILITGGAYQGKLEAAEKLYFENNARSRKMERMAEQSDRYKEWSCQPGKWQDNCGSEKKSDMQKEEWRDRRQSEKNSGMQKEEWDRRQSEKNSDIRIVEGETASLTQLQHADIISHFHLWIRALLKEGKEPCFLVEELLKRNPQVVIVLTQLGCGVVPMDAFDREYREIVGRIGCLLAKKAKAVYLVNCGITKQIK